VKKFRRGIVEDVDRKARADARKAVKTNNGIVAKIQKAFGATLALTADECAATRKATRETAAELRRKAKATVDEALALCATRKRGALWAKDAAEDCARMTKSAAASAGKLKSEAALMQAESAFSCAKKNATERGKFPSLLDVALTNLGEAQGAWRARRKERAPKGQSSGSRSSNRRAGERLQEWRQQEISNFAPEFRSFCTDNFHRVAAKAKKTGIELHEACADIAHDAGYAENPAQYLAERNPYEGAKFEQDLAVEQAKAMGFDPLEALRFAQLGKKKKPKARTGDLIFSLGGKDKLPKKKREKVAKVVDPTTATSAARRTKAMFVDDVPF